MTESRQKRKENIVEYLIYMWQVEDLIRACKFDMELIEKQVISQYGQPESVKREIRTWYAELMDMMRLEGVAERGHIRINKNVVIELAELHLQLLNSPEETVFKSMYYKTLPFIVQLRSKSGGNDIPEIETCLTAIYGFLLLKLQHREISEETANAVKQISAFLAFLAAKYKELCSN
jgi:hypothetical protein